MDGCRPEDLRSDLSTSAKFLSQAHLVGLRKDFALSLSQARQLHHSQATWNDKSAGQRLFSSLYKMRPTSCPGVQEEAESPEAIEWIVCVQFCDVRIRVTEMVGLLTIASP